jgi:GT2 family glycosyltransferase
MASATSREHGLSGGIGLIVSHLYSDELYMKADIDYTSCMQLSIIIISYNTKEITQRCLDTVFRSLEHDSLLKYEVIVLDNASSDGSVAMLQTYADLQPNLKVIQSKENLGFGKGNNEAVVASSGEYLLFLNSDTEAIDDAIPNLFLHYTKHGFDFGGARLLNKDGTVQPSVGRFYTLPIACAALFLFADRYHLTRYSPRTVKKVAWVSGACFITSRTKYDLLHGFDPEIFMYWEEVDLFYRAFKEGMTVGFFPQPTFIHLEGASSGSRTAPILKVFEGYIHFYKKHYSPLQVRLLKYMLQLKAGVSLLIGKLFGNSYLVETYSKAYEIVKKA